VRRAWLPLIWLIGTAVAVLVGWSAVQAVIGQVVPEQPGLVSFPSVTQLGGSPVPSPSGGKLTPASPTPTPAQASPPPVTPTRAPTPARPPANPSRTIAAQGGTVDVSCQGSQITLDWATPNAGFQVETEWHDSNTVLEVRFTSSSHESRIETWCSANQIQATVEEQSS
jgi:cytoskeletal protein RodZ